MRKTLVIAVREYRSAVRTKTFVISLVIMPVMGSLGLIAALMLQDQVSLEDKRFAVMDRTGQLYPALIDAAEEYNRTEVYADDGGVVRGVQIKPKFVLERVDGDAGALDEKRCSLSNRVRGGQLAGFVEIGADVLDPLRGEDVEVAYHTNNPMYRDFFMWFGRRTRDAVREWRVASAGLPSEKIDWVTRRIDFEERPLFVRSEIGGAVRAGANDHYVNIAAGVGLSLLMFVVILVGAIPLTYSVLEEKMQRSAEVLLGSVSPFQFMMGKVLGMVGVSLSIVTLYIVVGFYVAHACGYGHALPRGLINWFLLYQAGSILMFGSLFAAIGAACNDMKDAQNLMTPASFVACIPLFVIRPVMMEPSSLFSTLISFFPPATPMLMVMRLGLPAPVPLWQPILGLVIVLVSAVACVGLAARVFTVGILMQGKGANVKEMLQWAVYGIGHRPDRPERRHSVLSSATRS